MRASMGGVLSLFLVVLFIVIISSLLLFNVSYAKAFRVKNKIITTYEQYEGSCDVGSSCQEIIKAYEDRLGYNIKEPLTPDVAQNEQCFQDLGYCVIRKNAVNVDKRKAFTYKIRTVINVRFPLIQDILGIGTFKVSGETRTVYIHE